MDAITYHQERAEGVQVRTLPSGTIQVSMVIVLEGAPEPKHVADLEPDLALVILERTTALTQLISG